MDFPGWRNAKLLRAIFVSFRESLRAISDAIVVVTARGLVDMVRLLSVTFIAAVAVALTGFANGQSDEARTRLSNLRLEIEAVWQRPEFENLRSKTALWDREITPSMTNNTQHATESERQAMLRWADELARFGPQGIRAAQGMFSEFVAPAVADIMERYNKREIEMAVSMSKGQLSWGRYNADRIASAAQQFREYVALSKAWEEAAKQGPSPTPSTRTVK